MSTRREHNGSENRLPNPSALSRRERRTENRRKAKRLALVVMVPLVIGAGVAVGVSNGASSAPHKSPQTSTTTVAPTLVPQTLPACSTDCGYSGQLDEDLTTCNASGATSCHVETDVDGTKSVYGKPATQPKPAAQAPVVTTTTLPIAPVIPPGTTDGGSTKDEDGGMAGELPTEPDCSAHGDPFAEGC